MSGVAFVVSTANAKRRLLKAGPSIARHFSHRRQVRCVARQVIKGYWDSQQTNFVHGEIDQNDAHIYIHNIHTYDPCLTGDVHEYVHRLTAHMQTILETTL